MVGQTGEQRDPQTYINRVRNEDRETDRLIERDIKKREWEKEREPDSRNDTRRVKETKNRKPDIVYHRQVEKVRG